MIISFIGPFFSLDWFYFKNITFKPFLTKMRHSWGLVYLDLYQKVLCEFFFLTWSTVMKFCILHIKLVLFRNTHFGPFLHVAVYCHMSNWLLACLGELLQCQANFWKCVSFSIVCSLERVKWILYELPMFFYIKEKSTGSIVWMGWFPDHINLPCVLKPAKYLSMI